MRTAATIPALLITLHCCALPARGQSNDSLVSFFRFDDTAPLTCLLTLLPPLFIEHEMDLKAFLCTREFRSIRSVYGDRRAVDAIFVRAMRLTGNNTAISLFLCMAASLEHRSVGVKVPLFDIYFPLTDESEQEFDRRVGRLPSRLFADTPAGPAGDRDKLQHFFGSAFLSFLFESRGSADRVGEFVERGEEAFIVDGVNDDRDRHANRDGQRFGEALLANSWQFPSFYLGRSLASLPVAATP